LAGFFYPQNSQLPTSNFRECGNPKSNLKKTSKKKTISVIRQTCV